MRNRIIIFFTFWIVMLMGYSIGNIHPAPLEELGKPEPSVLTGMMKVDEIKIGMTGYGKTVFQGTKIEKFDVEVMGVLKNARGPKQDMILVKCRHPIVDKTGIIAGMSGSPVYIVTDKEKEPEGRLIGALSNTWQLLKEAIGGVTPIEDMLADMNKPLEKDSGYFKDSDDKQMVQTENPYSNSLNDIGIAPTTPVRVGVGIGEMRPIMTPLFISGMSSYRIGQLSKELEKYNLMPIQSGSVSAEIEGLVSKELEPGSPVGICLVRGDKNITGIGTVTYRDGDKILGFGHPMGLYGEDVSAALTNAYIYGVLPSIQLSTKFGAPVSEVGCLQQDRANSISGVMNKTAKMMPMKVFVENTKTGRKATFNYEVLHHRNIVPNFMPGLVMDSADALEIMPFEPALIEVIVHLKIKDLEPITFRRLVSDTASGAGCGAVNNIFNPIWKNPYMKIVVEDVSFELRILNENRSLQLINAWTEINEALPGDAVKIYCQFKPYLKEPFIKTMDFTIPKDLKPGQTVTITVMGSNNLMPPLPTPTNVVELVNYLKSFYDGGNLIAIMSLPDIDLMVKGDNYKYLPKSFLSAFINQWQGPVYSRPGYSTSSRSATLEKPLELGQDYLLSVEPMQHIVSGSRSVSVNVVRQR